MTVESLLLTIVAIFLALCVFTLCRALAKPYVQLANTAWSGKSTVVVCVLMLLVFVPIVLNASSPLRSGVLMVFIASLTLLGLLDARLKVLPNKITLPLLLAGLVLSMTGLTVPWPQSLLGMVTGFLLLYLPAWLYARVTGRDGVGYGDFKIMAAVGAWLGWQPLLFIIFVGGLCVAVFGLFYIKINRLPRTHTIPFGPFLSAATILFLLIQATAT